MTQVISVITKEYALLASDRRLVIGEGSRAGEVADDDTCKLVSVCNTFGIGYSGLARIEGLPTHEWIAKVLASENCTNPTLAAEILRKRCTEIFSALQLGRFRQQFVIAGWGSAKDFPDPIPFMFLVTNGFDDSRRELIQPRTAFVSLRYLLMGNEHQFVWVIGQPLTSQRSERLNNIIGRLVDREIGPTSMLRLLVEEIVHTSVVQKNSTVGTKILGFSIPRASVISRMKTGRSAMIAKQPDKDSATFTYFDPQFSEMQQFGPTMVCGETAISDVKTENDASRNFQAVTVKILNLPTKSEI